MPNLWEIIQSPFSNLKRYLTSFDISMPHRASDAEIALIMNTNLFRKMNEDELAELIHSVRIKKYRAGALILEEGETGTDLFIIAEGTARVFIKDEDGNKIELKILLPGHYFGEQAASGGKTRTRNASIEAVTDISLIQIPGKFIHRLLKKDSSLRTLIEGRKVNQAVNIIAHVSVFQQEMETLLANISNPLVLEYKNRECIFKIGDVADRVYIVIQGKAKLFIPQENNDNFSELVLNKGHLFGEMGVMNNLPRSATAIADGFVRLLAIDGDDFKRDLSILNSLKDKLTGLQRMYALPLRGTVEQYTRIVPGEGNAIMNVYKLDDNREVFSSTFLDKDEFIMGHTENKDDQCLRYDHNSNRVEVFIRDHRLVGIKSNGSFEGLPELCYLLLDDVVIDDKDTEQFKANGKLKIA